MRDELLIDALAVGKRPLDETGRVTAPGYGQVGFVQDASVALRDDGAMTDISERYARNAQAFLDTVAAVPAGGWSSPTPCEEWTAAELVQHVVDSQGMFLRFVGKEPTDVPAVADDPLGAVRAAIVTVQADLEDPAAAGTTFTGLMGEQTFEQAVDRFLSFDLVVHRWDLARAIGQDVVIDDAELDRLDAALAEFGDMPEMRGPGGFGPALEAAEGASRQDRVLAFLGRQV